MHVNTATQRRAGVWLRLGSYSDCASVVQQQYLRLQLAYAFNLCEHLAVWIRRSSAVKEKVQEGHEDGNVILSQA